ncbi:peptidylprolyl isomerase [Novosphingobium mangrovi (ex Huang et al. 2023)]|uniref:peptidylprolyl isomerase n=1 Tax=Novosphingobium mangrovi (ex Huang et al. 2023) TaxID=2976432 RepID=A0ABT2HZM0_9SPHN|nr:peptidylprolyl isomerase [Novosphingobium mangrovi (ex Huang et al. 2023)]MCT2397996.1 peptidylprolyl isomerase [Novosphingobium mangrovi (ex Huang et al. 2023)]
MRKILQGLVATLLASAGSALPAMAQEQPLLQTPDQIVVAAPAADWVRIAPSDLMVMDLAPDAAGRPRRVVIQLVPAPFSQGWVENIRRLVSEHWYDGIAVVRVQDNYVVQWGDPDGEVPEKAKPLPEGLNVVPESEYATTVKGVEALIRPGANGTSERGTLLTKTGKRSVTFLSTDHDAYANVTGFVDGWPFAYGVSNEQGLFPTHGFAWPVHCYGMVGVGRNVSPDTGTGAELYAVIGHAPRQLDRNIALVGRVIAGIEHLSSLPRGTGELSFYETPEERTPIVSVRMGDDVSGLPAYAYLSTESASFAAYADKRANRKDAFYIQPAGGVDVCNVPVPIRAVKP